MRGQFFSLLNKSPDNLLTPAYCLLLTLSCLLLFPPGLDAEETLSPKASAQKRWEELRNILEMEEAIIEGELEKPEVISIIRRKRFNFKPGDRGFSLEPSREEIKKEAIVKEELEKDIFFKLEELLN